MSRHRRTLMDALLEMLRTVRETLPGNTITFVLSVAAIGALISGAAAYVVDRAVRNSRPSSVGDSTEPSIALNCQRVSGFPSLEPSGIVRRFSLAPPSGGFMRAERTSDDGTFEWSEQPRTCFRCGLVNDGSMPIFNVVVSFQATFQEAIATGDAAFSSGSTTAAFPVSFTAPRIDSGPVNAFVFFVLNGSDQFLRVTPLSDVSFEMAGRGQITATLIRVGDQMIFPPEFDPKP